MKIPEFTDVKDFVEYLYDDWGVREAIDLHEALSDELRRDSLSLEVREKYKRWRDIVEQSIESWGWS